MSLSFGTDCRMITAICQVRMNLLHWRYDCRVRLLVLSDIHADADGLEAVLEHAGVSGWDQLVLLGDVIGYGQQPARTMAILSELPVRVAVTGNHEHMLTGLRAGRSLAISGAVRASLEHCLNQLDDGQLDWLEELPEVGNLPGVQLIHGSPAGVFDYVLSARDARLAEPHLLAPLCLIGHSHLPGVFLKESDVWSARPARRAEHTWKLPAGTTAILNPGSVWLNRDRTGGRSYGLLETGPDQERSFTVRRIRDAAAENP